MRHCIFIIIFLAGFVSSGSAQREIESKRLVFHKPFKEFFLKYPGIKEIGFSLYRQTDSVSLWIVQKSNNSPQRGDVFDMKHKGDRYSFQKKYGTLNFPSSIYLPFIDPGAASAHIEGRVRYDSVFMIINHWYESKNEGEEIFEKVEIGAEYEKGNKAFAKEMQDYFQHKKFTGLPEDSVVIIYGIVHPNKTILVDTVLAGQSSFAKSLVEFINKSGPWRPMEACGRKVKAYKKIYARLNSDNTFETEIY